MPHAVSQLPAHTGAIRLRSDSNLTPMPNSQHTLLAVPVAPSSKTAVYDVYKTLTLRQTLFEALSYHSRIPQVPIRGRDAT